MLFDAPPRALLAALVILTTACSSPEPPTAPEAVAVPPGTSVPPAAGNAGVFQRTGYAVTGRATLAINDGVARLDFSDDFSVGSAPGPFVYINTTNNPNTGRPLRVSALRSRTGAQSYSFQVPAGVQYGWVIIWCDQFNVGIAQAPIPLTP